MTAENWDRVPAGCICKWAAPSDGGWALELWNPSCPAEHDVGSGA